MSIKKIGNSIAAKGREFMKSARAASETSSLNNIIKAEKIKIDTNFKMMGKLYFDKYGDSPDEEFSGAINSIKASMEKINETNEEIEKIRRRNCCPNCGNRFKSDAMFCSKCGTRVREEEKEPAVIICQNCGHRLEEDALFCDSCGIKVDDTVDIQTLPENTDTYTKEQTDVSDSGTEAAPLMESPSETPTETASPSSERICPSCGEKQDDAEALFCNSCGTKL
ncbi:MAG: zinc ribbon domain-containing protein [Clostridium sp.]|nr:zinc ribbon domain-containing protein [Clostridium sp.]